MITKLQEAEAALAAFKRDMDNGHPWVPGFAFLSNPGLDKHVLSALEDFVRVQRVAEQSRPARRESLMEVEGVNDDGLAHEVSKETDV